MSRFFLSFKGVTAPESESCFLPLPKGKTHKGQACKIQTFFFKDARNSSPGTKDKHSLQVFHRIKEFSERSTPSADEALKILSKPALETFSALKQDLYCQVYESESDWLFGEHGLEGSRNFWNNFNPVISRARVTFDSQAQRISVTLKPFSSE